MSLIKRFDSEANRRAWQMFLNTQGEALSVDGIWGPATTAATKRFQAKNGLTADGLVGENTVSKAMQWDFAGFGEQRGFVQPTPRLLISAGHTNIPGRDRGAAGNGYIEGVEAVKIRDRVAELCRTHGFAVTEDGADGVNEPLSKALQLITGTNLALEFHFNAAASAAATGVEVLAKSYRRNQAQKIAEAIGTALGLPLRGYAGYKPDTSGQHSRLAFCEKGGLIVEVAFITNPADMKAYADNFESMCKAVADGLKRLHSSIVL